jgi:hypothetical protein
MNKSSVLKLATAALILIVAGSAPSSASASAGRAQAINTGSRYCSYGYDAYTAAGTSYARTIIHQQADGVSTPWLQGLYTHAGETRRSSAGWQGFSSSSVSDDSSPHSTGCF